MKVEYEKVISNRNLADLDTGEVFEQQVSFVKKQTYYSIRKLNVKVAFMDIMEIMEITCKSSRDIYIFGKLLDSADRMNEIRINISEFSKNIGVTRQQVTYMVKRMNEANMLKRISQGVYLVNPFVFKAKGSSNETIEKLQKETEWV